MPATATETTTTSAVLRSTLNSDGTWKHTLPARDMKRVTSVYNLLKTLALVPTLKAKADAVLTPLDALIDELCDD